MRRPLLVALLSALSLSLLAAARAAAADTPSGCERWRHPGLPDGPVVIGFFPGDLAAGRRACPRSEVSLWLRGRAIIDTPNFYGNLGASLLLSGSYVVRSPSLGETELFGTLEVLEFQFVQNATLKGTAMGLGQLTLGASQPVRLPRHVTVAPSLRLLIPTGTLTPRVRTAGGEVGVALSWHALPQLELHGLLAGDLTFGISAAAPLPRGGLLVGLGVGWAPFTWVSLVLDLNAHLGHRAPLDYLAPAVALRFRLVRTLNLEVGATLPVAGADRHDFLAALRVGNRF